MLAVQSKKREKISLLVSSLTRCPEQEPRLVERSLSGYSLMSVRHRGTEASASQDEHSVSNDEHPAWYTPRRLLALFCMMQFLVYADRGVRVRKAL